MRWASTSTGVVTCPRWCAHEAPCKTANVNMQPMIRALLVEDDVALAQLTARYLDGHGIITTVVHNGTEGLARAGSEAFDVVLLDVMLPGKSGRDICRALRATSSVPILMLTARGDEADRIIGFEDGADDYLPKPFSARELVARIQSHVRRSRGHVGPAGAKKLVAGPLSIEPVTLIVTLHGTPLSLTAAEVRLLGVFAERPNRVLSREQIIDLIAGAGGDPGDAFDRAVDVRISRLRQKLGDDPRSPKLLKTIRGMGYMLSVGTDSL
jgi:two-component system, OmpR family, response regulator